MTRLLLLALVASGAWASDGIVTGAVTAPDGRPLPSVEITAAGSDAGVTRALNARTGTDGRFRLEGLAYDTYTLSFQKAGYEADERVTATATLSEQEPEAEVTATMRKSAVITGHVVDVDGLPVPDVNVQLQVWQTARGRRFLRTVQSANTDDRGEYRIFGLGPERYLVRVTPYTLRGVNGLLAYEHEPLYYPGVPEAVQAQGLAVDWEDVHEGVDFRMRASPATAVEGWALRADGTACTGCFIGLMGPGGALEASVNTRADGWFGIRGLSPGSYQVTATARGTTESALDDALVAPDRPVLLELQLAEGGAVEGRVTVERGASGAGPEVTGASVQLNGVGGFGRGRRGARVDMEAGGALLIEDVPPGEYEVYVAGLPAGAYLDRITLSGRPLANGLVRVRAGIGLAGLELRIATDGATVEGTVEGKGLGRQNEAAPPGWVALIPSDYGKPFRYELLGDYRPEDAMFRISSAPPGRYAAVAVARSNRFDLGSAEDLAYLRARAVTVEVGAGETVNVAIPFVRNRE